MYAHIGVYEICIDRVVDKFCAEIPEGFNNSHVWRRDLESLDTVAGVGINTAIVR